MIPHLSFLLFAAANPCAAPPEPSPAVSVRTWTEGAVYPLVAAPDQISAIMLEPGERLISVAAGDTAQWVIGDTTSGRDASLRSLVLVKPVAAGLKTNMVIATDRRVYQLSLESRARAPLATLRWTYQSPGLVAVQAAAEPPHDTDVTALNFAYRIEGDRPPWRPVRVFDDGARTFIEFPAAFGQGEAPPLFLKGDRGRLELVNYRLKGRHYVVDRLFHSAELRLGEKNQVKVSIMRMETPAPKRRGS